ncbi:MAG TPA: serine/threonine-protein kinase [Verrucomicrobiae bacterium]
MNDDATVRSCPECRSPIPADAPGALCPKCVLAKAAAETEAGQPEQKPELPPLESVQAAFPQLEVLGLIGQGGMGFVYKARQPNLDRFVALKLLWPRLASDPAFAERFNREARVLARLNHPNIVAVYDFGCSGSFFYLLMEYVDGVNMRQAMRSGRFSPTEAFALVPRICDALQFAHEEGVLHRDIKPENILLDTKGRLKIADFGIAKILGEGRGNITLTEQGVAVGTPLYMAPEQLEHPQDVDQRADIYSLGVVFYEMLTGELPVGRFAPPSQKAAVDPRVDDVVLRTLEKERERRYRSAGEVKTRVEDIRSSVPPTGPHETMATGGVPPQLSGKQAQAPPAGIAITQANAAQSWSKKAIAAAVLDALALVPCGLLLMVFPFVHRLDLGGMGAVRFSFLPFLALGLFSCLPALFGAFFGFAALNDIRRAGGELYGRGLALCAALYWPLLVGDVVLLFGAVLLMKFLAWTAPGLTLLILPAAAVVIGAIDFLIAKQVWRATAPPGKPAPARLAPAAVVCALLVLSLPVLVLGVLMWVPLVARTSSGFAPPPPITTSLSDREVRVEVTTPPRQTFTVTCVVLSNRVPVSSPDFRAKVGPGSTPGIFAVTWRLVENAEGAPNAAPWEIVVEDQVSGTIAARLRPEGLPALTWTASTQARDIHLTSAIRESNAFEVARAFQSGSGPNEQSVDWSVRLILQSAKIGSTGSLAGGVETQFKVPAGQVAVFEVVCREGQNLVALPGLAAYIIASPDAEVAGKFLCLPESDPDGTGDWRRPWRVEITGAGNKSAAGGFSVPEAVARYGGEISVLTTLQPEAEVVHWAGQGDSQHPALGLRIRTLQSEPQLASHNSATGLGTNWPKAFSSGEPPGR